MSTVPPQWDVRCTCTLKDKIKSLQIIVQERMALCKENIDTLLCVIVALLAHVTSLINRKRGPQCLHQPPREGHRGK